MKPFFGSDKGKKSITHRNPRKRGGVATKRGISKEQVCVLVAQDRNGQVISQMAGKGRIKSTDIDKVLGAFIDTSALLCSDAATNYKKLAEDKGLQHEMVNLRKGIYVKKSIFHIQHVNAYHKRLKQFMNQIFKVWQPNILITTCFGSDTLNKAQRWLTKNE